MKQKINTYTYSCANCGSGVTKHHESIKTEPERQQYSDDARGLGHWHCHQGCRPCKVRTEVVAR